MSGLLQISDLSVSYGPVAVLKGATLDVNEQEIRAVLGANGAGKSTLLKAILGLVRITGGSIMYARTTELRSRAPHEIHRMGIAWAPQGRQTFSTLSVHENLLMGSFGESNQSVLAERLSRTYDLFPKLRTRHKQLAGSLSGGEQQMLSLARALMSEPRLLLMDEPSIGLSPRMTQQVFEMLTTLRSRGLGILLVEQNARQALRIADWAYVLEGGRVTVSAHPRELESSDSIRRAYLGG